MRSTVCLAFLLAACGEYQDGIGSATYEAKVKRDLSPPRDLTVPRDMSSPHDLTACGGLHQPCCGPEDLCEAGLVTTYQCPFPIVIQDSGFCLAECTCEP